MKLEYKIIGYSIAVIIIIILSILTAGIATLPTPAPTMLGMIILCTLLFVDMGVEIMRGKSPVVITNVGQWSIAATKDIYHFPWQSEILKEEKDKKKNFGNLSFIFPGGIDYWGINTHSSSESPVLIFPTRFEGREEKNYHVHANLIRKEFGELSPYIRYLLRKHFPSRVTDKTPIFEGFTSHLDGSDVPKNLEIEFTMIPKYKYASELEDRNEALYKELRKADDQKNSKRLFIGKEVSKVGEEQ